MPYPNQITAAQLMRLIGTSDAPAIYDVRVPDDIAADPRCIPAAIQRPHGAFVQCPQHAGRAVVVCHKGRKLSEGVAALLRCHGIAAEVLQGGHVAWAEAGLPLVPLKAAAQSALWVTRQRPKIDRIACPWLIRRFVQPSARFLFVAPAEVMEVADKFAATPFDIDGVAFSHEGDLCSFDVMLRDFGLQTPPLLRMAEVVRAADTNRHDLAPQAAGLLAISVGLSRQFRDDLAQLEAGMAIYDALYRWARDGLDESHDWTPSHGPI
ncbi:MAG: sulfurtransferase/chromate resistance protein [Cypionkella sp.]|nr:sulfurtransferase/chromate resistance protein [Cypionkella sp.]